MLSTNAAKTKDKRTAKSGVELQHRHFSFIPATIAGMPSFSATLRTQKRSVALAFADACATTNPKFDRKRFMEACGQEGGE
jgi:hypothetical protein